MVSISSLCSSCLCEVSRKAVSWKWKKFTWNQSLSKNISDFQSMCCKTRKLLLKFLCEISFVKFRGSKSCILNISKDLIFDFKDFGTFQKVWILTLQQFQHTKPAKYHQKHNLWCSKIAQIAVFQILNSAKLISCKNKRLRKSLNVSYLLVFESNYGRF